MEKILDFSHKLLSLPPVASTHGNNVDKLIIYVHFLMAALFLGWILYFFLALIKFRKSANPKADYVGVRGHLSNYIELFVVLVEGALLIGFAIPLWASSAEHFPTAAENPLRVELVAQQFAWNFHFGGADNVLGHRDPSFVSNENPWGDDKSDPTGKDDFWTLNELHVVVNRPVIINISSKDVIHSFKVISMRVTQDAIPGVPIPLHFIPTTIGQYQINCAQLCGNGHSTMAGGKLIVESQADFDKWIALKSKNTSATVFE